MKTEKPHVERFCIGSLCVGQKLDFIEVQYQWKSPNRSDTISIIQMFATLCFKAVHMPHPWMGWQRHSVSFTRSRLHIPNLNIFFSLELCEMNFPSRTEPHESNCHYTMDAITTLISNNWWNGIKSCDWIDTLTAWPLRPANSLEAPWGSYGLSR